jgi:pimeloyl-ACP methyl ester carboxylesterase
MSSLQPSAQSHPRSDPTAPQPRTTHRLNVGAVHLAVETFGRPDNVPVVLVMGATASMLWWPDELCIALAQSGYYVIRYDHRDTGQSTTGEPGEVDYCAEDLTNDLIGIMDALHVETAHLVGMSLGGYISQIASIVAPRRVRSLTLIAAEPLGATDELPGIDERFMDHFSSMGDLNWSDDNAVEEFLVGIGRLSAGTPERFDETGTRQRIRAEIDRALNIASAFNHAMLTTRGDWENAIDRITQPTLVIHGENDPIIPLPNGEAIAHRIQGARLHTLVEAGHELNPRDLPTIHLDITTFLSEVDTHADTKHPLVGSMFHTNGSDDDRSWRTDLGMPGR